MLITTCLRADLKELKPSMQSLSYVVYDVTYTDREADRKINAELGLSYGLISRLRMGGIGSERMIILGGTGQILEIFSNGFGQNFANIELRPKGLLIRFRYKLEVYAFAIPYNQLSIFKSDVELAIHRGNTSVRLQNYQGRGLNKKFIRKIINEKAKYLDEN